MPAITGIRGAMFIGAMLVDALFISPLFISPLFISTTTPPELISMFSTDGVMMAADA
ncbi:MAG: hypothetical protein ACRC47_11590 [Shewanella sp.]